MDTTPNIPLAFDEPSAVPVATPAAPPAPGAPPVIPAPLPAPLPESRGCLYALSQPPLMLFLAVIAVLLAVTGAHDLLLL